MRPIKSPHHLSEPCHYHTHTGYIVLLSYPSLQAAGWTCIATCDPFCHAVCAASCSMAATSRVFMEIHGLQLHELFLPHYG